MTPTIRSATHNTAPDMPSHGEWPSPRPAGAAGTTTSSVPLRKFDSTGVDPTTWAASRNRLLPSPSIGTVPSALRTFHRGNPTACTSATAARSPNRPNIAEVTGSAPISTGRGPMVTIARSQPWSVHHDSATALHRPGRPGSKLTRTIVASTTTCAAVNTTPPATR